MEKTPTKEELDEAIWKDIPGYEGFYQVSNTGKIKSLPRESANGGTTKEKLISPSIMSRGYYSIKLSKNGIGRSFLLHRIIASVFIPNPDQLPEVNHKNGIKTDFRISNLEWCSRIYNVQHARKTGLQRTSIPFSLINEIKWLSLTMKQCDIARKFGMNKHTVSKIIRNIKGYGNRVTDQK